MRYSLIAIISMGGQLASLGLAFLFHFLLARWLGLALYGDFGVLLATFTILFHPVISVQAVLMREVAQLHTRQEEGKIAWLIVQHVKKAIGAGLGLGALAFVLLFGLGILPHPLEAALFLLSVPFFYAIFVFNSYYQGTQQPIRFAGILVLTDFLRLVLTALLVGAGLGLLGVGLSYVGTALLILIPLFILLYVPAVQRTQSYSFSLLQHLRWVFPTYALLSMFLAIDLFFVRQLVGAESAGLYNAALTLARAVFYAGIGAMNAFLPQSSKLDVKKDARNIWRALGISLVLLLAFAIAIFLFRDLLLGTLYGEVYRTAAPLLAVLVFSMLLLASTLLLINFQWSQGEQKQPLLLVGLAAVVSLVLFYLFTRELGPIGTAYASLTSTVLLFLLNLTGSAWLYRKIKSKSTPSLSRPN